MLPRGQDIGPDLEVTVKVRLKRFPLIAKEY